MKTLKTLVPVTLLTLFAGSLVTGAPLGTAFTYQGRLTDGAQPATGSYDLMFTVYDLSSGGSAIAGPITNSPVAVSNGLFTVTLDFGPGAFAGDARWLELAVRSNGVTGDFAVLAPRQPLTPSPYALYAPAANTAVTANSVAAASVTSAGIADGEVVRSLNTLHDAVTLAAGTNVSLASAGNLITISATPSTVVTNAGWGLSGNTGTTANNFLGTTDGMALELRVNGARALRLEPNATSPNVIGGFRGNSVDPGLAGVTISGGGYSTRENTALASANYGTIAGGNNNTIQGYASFIGGGRNNVTGPGTYDSVIGGGANNTNNSYRGALLGGQYNLIQTNSNHAFLGSGLRNEVAGDASSILGGRDNTAESLAAVVLGGESNTVRSTSLLSLTIPADRSVIAAGLGNSVVGASHFFLGGGQANTAFRSDWAVLGGGSSNRITGDAAFIGAGQNNTNSGLRGAIAGGFQNRVESTADNSFIGGGWSNTMRGTFSTIAGGVNNVIESTASFAGIGAGSANIASGDWAMVPGGNDNLASGLCSLAAGMHAKARHPGSFVWADTTTADFASTAANQFLVRAAEAGINTAYPQATLGIQTHARDQVALRLQNSAADGWGTLQMADAAGHNGSISLHYGSFPGYTGNNSQLGLYMPLGSYLVLMEYSDGQGYLVCNKPVKAYSFSETSDRNVKTGIEPVSPAHILDQVAALPISTWAFTNATSTRHLGPMAQDFHAAFGLGNDDKTISARDVGSVALAAIQGLNQKLEARNAALAKEVADLKAMVSAMAEKLDAGSR